MLELLIPVVVGIVSAAGGYSIGRYKARIRWPLSEPVQGGIDHPHAFDTMQPDGYWYCSCGKPAPDDKQPALKVVD